GIVDAAIHPLGVETEWVGHAHDDPLAVLQGEQGLGSVPGVDRDVGAEPERVELIDPRVIAAFDAAGLVQAFELRQRLGIERPAFWAVLARGARPVERTLALAPIEAGEMAARQRGPVDAVSIDVAAARRESPRLGLLEWWPRPFLPTP